MGEAVKIEINNVYEETPGQWVALVRHVGEDYSCGGADRSPEDAVRNAMRGILDMLKARGLELSR